MSVDLAKESSDSDSGNNIDQAELLKLSMKHKHKLRPTDIQRHHLDRLLSRVDKPVTIPVVQDKPKLKPPKDIVRNVQGSSAGAGSGEFHVYRAHRRREYTRLKIIEEDAKKEEQRREFEKKMDVIKKQEDEKTARKRAKRQKKKQKKQVKKQKTAATEGDSAFSTETNPSNKPESKDQNSQDGEEDSSEGSEE